MNKKIIREKYIVLRNDIKDKKEKSQIITKKIKTLEEYNSSKVIAIYNSLNSEVDTSFLINDSLDNGKIVCLPKVIDKYNMEFYKIDNILDAKYIGTFGIKEPIDNKDNIINKNDIDLMIIPGICFDNNKNRIGFGKGYYDRYLNNIKNNIYKIAICFDEQIMKDNYINSDINDINMDLIISDKNIIK